MRRPTRARCCRAAGSLHLAMAPPWLCRPSRPWLLLLLLLNVTLLGAPARAEPTTGSAVPAQSRCLVRAPPHPACGRPLLAFVPGSPLAPPAVRLPSRPFGGGWGMEDGGGAGAPRPPTR